MARLALAAFAAALAVGALLGLAHLTKQREVVASTPSAYTGGTLPISLPALI